MRETEIEAVLINIDRKMIGCVYVIETNSGWLDLIGEKERCGLLD